MSLDTQFDSSSGLRIEKLLGEQNYQNWKSQIITYLKDKKVWWLVEQKTPTVDHAPESIRGLLEKNPKLLPEFQIRATAILKASIDFTQYSRIRFTEDTNPHELWSRIIRKYEPKTQQSLMQVSQELFSIKMKTGETVQAFADRLEETIYRYESFATHLKGTVLATTKCTLFLNGLSSQYSNAITALNMVNKAQEFEELLEILSAHEKSTLPGATQVTSSPALTMSAVSSKRGNNSKYFSRGGGKHGRNFSRGPKFNGPNGPEEIKGRPKGRSGNTKQHITCFVCGKQGHMAKDCRYRKDKPQQSTRSNFNQAQSNYNNFNRSYHMPPNHVGSNLGVATSFMAAPVHPNHDVKRSAWLVDSGCTYHVCNNKSCFLSICSVTPICITLADGSSIPLTEKGVVSISFIAENNHGITLKLYDVYYSPNSPCNLLSVSALLDSGVSTLFDRDDLGRFTCVMYDRYNDVMFKLIRPPNVSNFFLQPGPLFQPAAVVGAAVASGRPASDKHHTYVHLSSDNNNNYINDNNINNNVNILHNNNISFNHFLHLNNLTNFLLYHHKRLAHINMNKLIKHYNIKLPSNFILPICNSCLMCKSHRLPFPKSSNVLRSVSAVGDCLHVDILGPFPTIPIYNYKYILVVVDEFSRFVQIFILCDKTSLTFLKCLTTYLIFF